MEIKANTNKTEKKTKPLFLRRLPTLLMLPLGLVLPQLLKLIPGVIDTVYFKGIYPVIRTVLSFLTGLVPFSIAEAIVILVPVCLLLVLAYRIVMVVLRKKKLSTLLHYLINLASVAGVMTVLFYLLWGANYFQSPLSSALNLEVKERETRELYDLCMVLSKEAASLRTMVEEDGNGVFSPSGDRQRYFDKIPAAYKTLSQKYKMFSGYCPLVKSVTLSHSMSYTGITGVYFPYTAEPNVNVDQMPLLLYATAAHETAHYFGVAAEDGANFVAFLACAHSDDPSIRYSGVMLALVHGANALYKQDMNLYKEVRKTYSDGMVRDLAAQSAYWKQFEGPVDKAFTKSNDRYLKHNQQSSGVNSYGQMVDLLLAYYAKGELASIFPS